MNKFTVAVLSSSNGGNFCSLIKAQKEHGFTINCLIVDRACGAINHALSNNIPVCCLQSSKITLAKALINSIPPSTDLIVLAGFLNLIPPEICFLWKNKIINIHPSLLPKFGGKGMYGKKVHECVMEAGEKFSGCTVHFVTPDIDAGEIILQEKIPVNYAETPWQLGGRVFELESKLIVDAVQLMKSQCC